MELSRRQVQTLWQLLSYDQAPGCKLRILRGEIVVEWQDRMGIHAKMALLADGQLALPRKRPRRRIRSSNDQGKT